MTCRTARVSHRLASVLGFVGAASLTAPIAEAQVGASPETFFNLVSKVEFSIGGDVATGQAVAAGDLNGDGRTDLVVVRDDEPPSLLVLLGVENAGYVLAATIPFSVSTDTFRPLDLLLKDFTSDGVLDILAIAPIRGGSLFAGNGDGTFAAEVPLGINFPGIPLLNPVAIEAADLDGDALQDLVTTYPVQGENGLEVRYGLPDGTFDVPLTFGPDLGSESVRIVDLNNDNLPDIVTEAGVFLENLGGRNFAAPASIPAFSNRIAPRFADLNGDGWLDFVAMSDGNAVFVTLSTGPLSYAPSVFIASAGDVQQDLVDLADVDGNGSIDILTYEVTTNELLIFLNDGTGTFPTVIRGALDASLGLPENPRPTGLLLTDLNGGGQPDVVVTIDVGPRIVVFRNTYIHRPLVDQSPAPFVVSAGQLAQLTATFVSGIQPISYRWFKDDVALADGPTIVGADSPTLSINPVLALDAGLYTLRASNLAGQSFTRSVALAVVDNQGVPDTDLDDDGDLDIDDLQILIEGLEND